MEINVTGSDRQYRGTGLVKRNTQEANFDYIAKGGEIMLDAKLPDGTTTDLIVVQEPIYRGADKRVVTGYQPVILALKDVEPQIIDRTVGSGKYKWKSDEAESSSPAGGMVEEVTRKL